jgi:hypothetical protein
MRANWIAVAAIVGVVGPAAGQVYIPIPVTGYTQDVIADAVGTASSTTTAAFDNGIGAPDNNVLFEQGYAGGIGSAGNGLPSNGAIVTSANRSYQLGPISGSNSLRITNSTGAGTLVLATPAREAALSLLLANAGGSPGLVTVNWSDGQSSTFPYTAYDWFQNGATGPNSGVAMGGLGRVDRQTGVPSANDASEQPPPKFAIYYYDIDLTGDANYQAGALIDSLTFPWPTGFSLTVVNVMGVSGSVVPIPEPSSLLLTAAAGLAGIFARPRKPG